MNRTRTLRRWLPQLLALAVVAFALALPGCGEKAEPATTGPVVTETTTATATPTTGEDPDAQRVSQAVTRFLSSTDLAVCTSGITPALLMKAYGDREGCVRARKADALAKSVQVANVQIVDASATATARASGGGYGSGQTIELSLVRDGADAWRVDAARSTPPAGG